MKLSKIFTYMTPIPAAVETHAATICPIYAIWRSLCL